MYNKISSSLILGGGGGVSASFPPCYATESPGSGSACYVFFDVIKFCL